MKISKILMIVLSFQLLISQTTQDFLPQSLNLEYNAERQTVVLPTVNVPELLEQDERMSHLKKMRFGYEHELNQNFIETANMINNGDNNVFLMQYFSYDAFALRATFEPFYLPEGVRMFVYNGDMTQIEGAYTSENNNDAQFFSTPLIDGERIIVELNVPNHIDLNEIQLNVSTIIHDYVGINNLMNSESDRSCGANIMCEQADPYLDQINAAAWLDMGGYICSGAMVNNMNQDLTPYFLTANHCTNGSNPQGFRFYFNYYVNGCTSGQIIQGANAYSSITRSTCDCITGSGENINIPGPDFTLLEITDGINENWEVFYAGWNATDPTTMPISVGVHHPGGDPKKINYDTGYATSSYWDGPAYHSHWFFHWDEGGTEGGSSGSPMYDNGGRIAGVLTGGAGECTDLNSTEYYGKIAKAWEWGDSPSRRLKDWLDPDDTGELLLGGTYVVYSEYTLGDVNDDGNINIQDIILLINYIMGNLIPEYPQDAAADMNEDGLINIQDIIIIISEIVNG
jgi:lysyl endopeptidase